MTCTVLYLLLLRKVICILNSVFSCAVAESGTSRTSRVQLWPPSSLPSRLLQLPGTENQAQRTWENTSKYSRCCEGRVEELCFWLLNSLCWPMEEHQATRLRICRCWMFIHATQAKAWCWNLSHAASKVGSLKFANGSTIRTQSCKYQTDVKVDLKLYKFTAFKAFKDKEMNHSGTRMVLEYCGNHQCSNLCRTWWLFLSTVATTSRNQGSTSPPATERSSNSKICQAVDALMLFPSQIPTRYIYIYTQIFQNCHGSLLEAAFPIKRLERLWQEKRRYAKIEKQPLLSSSVMFKPLMLLKNLSLMDLDLSIYGSTHVFPLFQHDHPAALNLCKWDLNRVASPFFWHGGLGTAVVLRGRKTPPTLSNGLLSINISNSLDISWFTLPQKYSINAPQKAFPVCCIYLVRVVTVVIVIFQLSTRLPFFTSDCGHLLNAERGSSTGRCHHRIQALPVGPGTKFLDVGSVKGPRLQG